MNNLGAALGWKYNHVSGIRTKNGIIIGWPTSDLGPEPNQSQQIVIISEYEARDQQDEQYARINDNKILKALALVCADQFGMTPAQLKAAVKDKM